MLDTNNSAAAQWLLSVAEAWRPETIQTGLVRKTTEVGETF